MQYTEEHIAEQNRLLAEAPEVSRELVFGGYNVIYDTTKVVQYNSFGTMPEGRIYHTKVFEPFEHLRDRPDVLDFTPADTSDWQLFNKETGEYGS